MLHGRSLWTLTKPYGHRSSNPSEGASKHVSIGLETATKIANSNVTDQVHRTSSAEHCTTTKLSPARDQRPLHSQGYIITKPRQSSCCKAAERRASVSLCFPSDQQEFTGKVSTSWPWQCRSLRLFSQERFSPCKSSLFLHSYHLRHCYLFVTLSFEYEPKPVTIAHLRIAEPSPCCSQPSSLHLRSTAGKNFYKHHKAGWDSTILPLDGRKLRPEYL